MSHKDGTEPVARSDVRIARLVQVVSIGWLLVLSGPISALLRPGLTIPAAASLAGVVVFVALYLWVILQSAPRGIIGASQDGTGLERRLPIGVLATIAVVLILADGPPWLDLIVFTAVAAAFRLQLSEAAWTLPAIVMLAIVAGSLARATPQDIGWACTLSLSIGAGQASIVYALSTVRELRAAREEIARLAISEERLRFARDLHDLLGHNLSLIALKSELAGQLVDKAPDRAAAEMRDVEQVARTALREVREAVAGYRQPTLASELAAATEILSASGIAFRWVGDAGRLPAPIEAALAWTVREGITNVIRHSRARSCTVKISRDSNRVVVEVIDDGRGARERVEGPPPAASGGHNGLAGLSERVAAVGGQVDAGPRDPGGFRLTATVPLARGAPGGDSAAQTNATIRAGGKS